MKKQIVEYSFSLLLLICSTTINAQILGVAFGPKYENQSFIDHIHDLGVQYTHINIWWHETEPSPGNYNYEFIDSFMAQLSDNTIGLLRITSRYNVWATSDSKHTVPSDLTVGGPYYNYVYNVVSRTNGTIKFFENNWEADYDKHWNGTADQYAELTRTFYQAVKAADPDALVIMGGSIGILSSENLLFWNTLFDNLANDNATRPFDMFDVHLYNELYDIPERVGWFRDKMDTYPQFDSVPIVVTEYGGPSPQEFEYVDEAAFIDLINEIIADTCILAGDLKSTTLHPEGYPDPFRMFAFGIEPELNAKRDRIQGRQMVQRSILALSAGVKQLGWWNLIKTGALSCGCDPPIVHPVFGKMCLMDKQENGTFVPNQAFYYYQIMASFLENIVSIERVECNNPDIYLFSITRPDNSILYVVWEKRDQFYGEDEPSVELTLGIPWQTGKVKQLFGHEETVFAVNGNITISITDTPVFIEENQASSIIEIGIKDDNINIFPNPTSGIFTIESKNLPAGQTGIQSIEITNVKGQKIFHEMIKRNNSDFSKKFDVSGYPKGIYIVEVRSEKLINAKKLVLE